MATPLRRGTMRGASEATSLRVDSVTPWPCRYFAPFAPSHKVMYPLNAEGPKGEASVCRAGCTAFLASHLRTVSGELLAAKASPRGRTAAHSLPLRRYTEALISADSLPCGLPRACLASTMLMPSCAQAGWEGDSATATRNHQPLPAESPDKLPDYCALPNAEAISAGPDLKGKRMAADNRKKPDDKSACATAAGRLLERARILQSTAAGLYCMLPLGFRVLKKIEAICHQVLAGTGASPLSLPNLMPVDWLHNSDVRSFPVV